MIVGVLAVTAEASGAAIERRRESSGKLLPVLKQDSAAERERSSRTVVAELVRIDV